LTKPTSHAHIYTLSLHDALPISAKADNDVGSKQFLDFKEIRVIDNSSDNIPDIVGLLRIRRNNILYFTFELRLFRRKYLSLGARSEEHTSELQSRENLVCRLLLE